METLPEKLNHILKTVKRRIGRISDKLDECTSYERVRQFGELLQAAQEYKKGMTSIELLDYYSEDEKTVTVETDPALDRFKNAEKYFKKAGKLEKSIPHQEKRLVQAEKLLKRIENVKSGFEKETITGEEAIGELAEMGFARFFPDYNKPLAKKETTKRMRSFTSSEGFTIYVGKSAQDNDHLTFRIGSGKDVWLHVGGFQGSHVLIKTQKGVQVPRQTLREAAALAVYCSKARGRFRTEVTYSFVHNIRKASRSKPGLVTVNHPKYLKSDKRALDVIMPEEME